MLSHPDFVLDVSRAAVKGVQKELTERTALRA
jgi:hypothetical protein